MPSRDDEPSAKTPRTVFDTSEWAAAWSRTTIERFTVCDDGTPPIHAVDHSPFWAGYEADAGVGPLWDQPIVTFGSIYCFTGPGYVAHDTAAVEELTDRARRFAAESGAAGVLVANLPVPAARAWADARPPDLLVQLDIAYSRTVGDGSHPVVGSVSKRVRGDWRRRWRRATECGVRLVEDTKPAVADVDDVLALANASSARHGWPPLYDRKTASEVLGVPGARLFRAVWSERTVAGLLAIEHDGRLYLWAGGAHPELLRSVSPYLFLLYELLATADARGWKRIEFGRGSYDSFKRRYGFEGRDLLTLWYASHPRDVPADRRKLEALQGTVHPMRGSR